MIKGVQCPAAGGSLGPGWVVFLRLITLWNYWKFMAAAAEELTRLDLERRLMDGMRGEKGCEGGGARPTGSVLARSVRRILVHPGEPENCSTRRAHLRILSCSLARGCYRLMPPPLHGQRRRDPGENESFPGTTAHTNTSAACHRFPATCYCHYPSGI